jgi:hypothetical protein
MKSKTKPFLEVGFKYPDITTFSELEQKRKQHVLGGGKQR